MKSTSERNVYSNQEPREQTDYRSEAPTPEPEPEPEPEPIKVVKSVKCSTADLVAIYSLQKAGFTAEDFA